MCLLFNVYFKFVCNGTKKGDCMKHPDCPWDKKCVLFPLPVSHPESGSIFAYRCILRSSSSEATDDAEIVQLRQGK